MATVILVKKEDLERTPVAFQQYVEEYFAEKKIAGILFMVCSTFVILPKAHQPQSGLWGHKVKKGVGPRHSGSLDRFKEGLDEGQELNDWMRGSELIWKIEVPRNDNSYSVG